MIRSGIPLRLALAAGLFLPSLAFGQDPKPADEVRDAQAAYQKAVSEAKKASDAAQLAALKAYAADKAKAAEADQRQIKASGIQKGKPGSPAAPLPHDFSATKYYMPRQARTVRVGRADPLEAKTGLVVANADDALRAQLGLPGGQGVVVASVKAESLADKGGLKVNDVLTGLDNQLVMDVEQVRARMLRLGQGEVRLTLIREGKPLTLKLDGPKEAGKEGSGNYWIGVPVSPVDATLRSHLQGLPEGVGLIANDVVAESPAAKAGLKKFDIMKALGDKPLKDSEGLIAAVQATEGKPTPLEILRAGAPVRIEITPVRRDQNKVVETFFNIEVNPYEAVDLRLVEALKAANPGIKMAMPNPTTFFYSNPTGTPAFGGAAPSESVEALLKEVKALVEEVKKEVEAMKKPAGSNEPTPTKGESKP